MKKLLSVFLILFLATSNICAGTLEMDWMEGCSTDALTQAAYVTNDSLDAYTKTASHFDGADTATAYTDPVAGAYTFIGTAQLDTAQYKFGTASLLLDGNSDYVSLADSASWTFGSGNFTVDFWIRFSGVSPGQFLVSNWTGTSSTSSFAITMGGDEANTKFVFNTSFTDATTSGWQVGALTPTTNTWYHVAFVRNGNDFNLYVNGTLDKTYSSSKTLIDSTAVLRIGASVNASPEYFLNGWMDEVRVSNGIARWTANFTPPIQPYPEKLNSYSEATIKTQGSYALKAVAAITDSLNKTLTKTFAVNSNLTGVKNLRLDVYALRTGSNFKIGLHDTGGTTTEITPTIATSNTWQPVNWDWSSVSDANKDVIDTCTITITNADSANTIYLDYHEIAQAIDVFGWVN